MIYVDEIIPWGKSKTWRWESSCHLFCLPDKSSKYLHDFAKQLRLKRSWFQGAASIPHYDLNESKRNQAVDLGAVGVDRQFVSDTIKEWRVRRESIKRLRWEIRKMEKALS